MSAVEDFTTSSGSWPPVPHEGLSMSETPDRIEAIFAAAVALTDADQRAAYLEQACAGDAALRRQVEARLRARAPDGPLLDRMAIRSPELTEAYSPGATPDIVIAGRYKLFEEIGEGGMGTVWLAEQTQPVRRKVALKLIKTGLDSRAVLARFEAERQALAVMDHPNIAKVLDGGATDTGRPFFVMEYVKGMPITEFCDAARLSVPERLQLFAEVCSAVQHAHQKGIIHRDLKPSNILVASGDDRPVPKVIDFGLAKAMHQSLTERTLHTAHETVLGTPLYMSPEQAQLNNLDVDTRSDIYSLGVVLYELLTGTTPLVKQHLEAKSWEEIKRLIREEDPPRPSSRLSSTQTLPALAAGRRSEPARLTKLVRGELDWIVMKALEKDRSRRYETANGFAADVQRYLSGEPVLAAPPSVRYRLGKLAHKYRTALTTAAAIALLLVAGVAVSAWQAFRATRAESASRLAEQEALQAQQAATERAEGERLARLEAQEEKRKAEKAAAAEKLANADAQKRLRQVEKANDILGSIFQNLDPREIARAERPLQAILVEKLDRAVAQLEGESIGDPLVVAAMQVKLGISLLGLGAPHKAVVLLEKARATYTDRLGAEDRETLRSMNYLAVAYKEAGKTDQAVALHKQTLEVRKARLGPEDPDTLMSMSNLASTYRAAGKLDLAVQLFEQTVKLSKAHFGLDHPETLTNINNLAVAYGVAGQVNRALPLLEETLERTKARFGADYPDTLASMSNLAAAYRAAGKPDRAVPLYEQTIAVMKVRLGPDHPDTLTSMGNLAAAYQDSGKLDRALWLFEETLRLSKTRLGPNHPSTLNCMNNLAAACWRAKQLDRSIPLLEETVKRQEANIGRDHPDTLTAVANLGINYKDAGRLKDALPLLEEAHRAARKYPILRWVGPHLLDAYEKAGENAKLASMLREQLVEARKALPGDSPQLAGLLAQLSMALQQQHKSAEAEPLLRECLLIRQKAQPDAWTTFNTQSMLGGALLDQKKYADAEPLLRAGYEGMKKHEGQLPPQAGSRLTDAVERLVRLYDAIGKKDEAARWRKEWQTRKEGEAKPAATKP
jgi:tetratricopeptide (TPR) repeat protein